MGGEMMKGCGLVVVEEKERKRGPDEEHQNIQSTVLASPLCLPELLVTLLHSGRRSRSLRNYLVFTAFHFDLRFPFWTLAVFNAPVLLNICMQQVM